jgi:hypothetical protein
MTNPLPRMQMVDGFNEGWIDFPDRGAGARKGQVTIDQAIDAIVNKGARTQCPKTFVLRLLLSVASGFCLIAEATPGKTDDHCVSVIGDVLEGGGDLRGGRPSVLDLDAGEAAAVGAADERADLMLFLDPDAGRRHVDEAVGRSVVAGAGDLPPHFVRTSVRQQTAKVMPFGAVWSLRNDDPACRRLLSLVRAIARRSGSARASC